MLRFFSSLRVQLAGLVLFAVLPTLGLVVHEDLQQRRAAERQVLAEARRLSEQAARDIDLAVRDARTMLDLLAGLPEIRRGDPAACERIFRDLLRKERGVSGDTTAGPAGAGGAEGPQLARNAAAAMPCPPNSRNCRRESFFSVIGSHSFVWIGAVGFSSTSWLTCSHEIASFRAASPPFGSTPKPAVPAYRPGPSTHPCSCRRSARCGGRGPHA